jgi:hypothetical protein
MINDAWIYGSSGRIHIPSFIWAHSASLIVDNRFTYNYEPDFVSNGYNYEVMELERCVREGKIESEIMSWDESLMLMETMDKVRAQWNFRYPGE